MWQSVRHRAGAAASDVGEKVADAIDETGDTLASFIRMPVRAASAAGQTVVNVSTVSTKAVYHTSAKGVSLVGSIFKATGSFIAKPLKKRDSDHHAE